MMIALAVLFVALALVHPAIVVLKGRKAHDPPATLALGAVRESGFVALVLGLLWPRSSSGAHVLIGAAMALFVWSIWHLARSSRAR